MARRFDFVNISNPKNGLSKADRSTVRSQAAHSGYDSLIGPRSESSRRRRKYRADGGAEQEPKNPPVVRLSQTKTNDKESSPTQNNGPSSSRTLAARPPVAVAKPQSYAQSISSTAKIIQPGENTAEEDDVDIDEEVITKLVLDRDRELTDLVQSTPRTGLLGAGRVDPFWTFPVARKPFMPAIIDHQITELSPAVPELDALHERALLRYFSVAISEPSLLYSMLAFAAAHRAQRAGALVQGSVQGDEVLWLKGMAINSINSALQDPRRSLLDTTIGAVVTMASWEHVYGDFDGFHAHMLGAQKMVALRGGLKQLGLHGIAARLAGWVDYCQAFVTGGKMYFDHGGADPWIEEEMIYFFGWGKSDEKQ